MGANDTLEVACLHNDTAETRSVCVHLVTNRENDYVTCFTGQGMACDLICTDCASGQHGPVEMRQVCVACFEDIKEQGFWEGIQGQPEVLERPSSLRFTHRIVTPTRPVSSPPLALEPIEHDATGALLALTADGELLRVALGDGGTTRLAHVPDTANVRLTEDVLLRLSPNGQLAAVANTHGQHGVVIDLERDQITMHLERDDYCIEHSSFPLAFFEHNGRTLLVHGTEWNRLDISDPITGERITDRPSPLHQRHQSLPVHYLDYFHCGLSISPDQRWIVDNGWIWAPVGRVSAWNLQRWLSENVWESEDGPSRHTFYQRWYYWDGPLCWIDADTLAVWGIGADEQWQVAGACFFDVAAGKMVHCFAGPVGKLTYDEYLFSYDAQEGTSIWDIATGERLVRDPDLRPACYHHASHSFVTPLPDGTFRMSTLAKR